MSKGQLVAGCHACTEFAGLDSSSHLQPQERKQCVCKQPEKQSLLMKLKQIKSTELQLHIHIHGVERIKRTSMKAEGAREESVPEKICHSDF